MITTPHTSSSFEEYYLLVCSNKIELEYLPKIRSCIAILKEDDIWWKGHSTNNSIGNLLLHLTGNITQWVVQHLGEQEYVRDRNAEFSADGSIPTDVLLHGLELAVLKTVSVLKMLPAEKMLTSYTIQGYTVTGAEAILHVTEHFGYHTGQIVYITKLRTGKDLHFYDL